MDTPVEECSKWPVNLILRVLQHRSVFRYTMVGYQLFTSNGSSTTINSRWEGEGKGFIKCHRGWGIHILYTKVYELFHNLHDIVYFKDVLYATYVIMLCKR